VSLQYFGIDDGHTVIVLDLCVFNFRHIEDVVFVGDVGVGNEGGMCWFSSLTRCSLLCTYRVTKEGEKGREG
jgi:hypothetical protein